MKKRSGLRDFSEETKDMVREARRHPYRTRLIAPAYRICHNLKPKRHTQKTAMQHPLVI